MDIRPAQEIWTAALGELQIGVSKPNYRTWLEKTIGLSYQDNEFIVGVPNPFIAEYLDKNQRSLIEKTLIGLTQRDINVIFQVDGRYQNSGSSYGDQGEIPIALAQSPNFNSRYTFASFVVGSCSSLAHAAALEVARNPGGSHNPLFIYGGVGLGKTHLLQAIGHVALVNHIQVLYVSAEQFTNEFINAIQEKKTREFRHKYRSVDMLLIDDVHFIAGKGQTEESFFHTFDELYNTNRQIVITSDFPPKTLPFIQDRLRSRFEWGLVTGVQPPDLETRLAILQAKAKDKGVNVTLDVLELIAQRAQRNVRELEGYLNRVIAFATLVRTAITPKLAAQALEDIASKKAKSPSITPSLIIETVARSFQLSPLYLKSRRRDRETALARQVAMYLTKQETNCSLAQIGIELGNRDHSTVIHACKKIESHIDSSPELKRKILDIQQRIYSELNTGNY
ncbi:MAG TPA: chromosomal replication initiator protein DnaA [Dehalococcoidia bacterium]|nr:chromosomal replication initiator protein DnaA [Dehalococcoidia bacterium]